MTTNLWVKQKWYDYKLRWDPEEYNGVTELYVKFEPDWFSFVKLTFLFLQSGAVWANLAAWRCAFQQLGWKLRSHSHDESNAQV